MLETRSLVTPPSERQRSESTSNLPESFHLLTCTLFRNHISENRKLRLQMNSRRNEAAVSDSRQAQTTVKFSNNNSSPAVTNISKFSLEFMLLFNRL